MQPAAKVHLSNRVRAALRTTASTIASTAMRPRIAAALRENAELLRAFKQIATLQRIDAEPPRARTTDFAGGARKAAELGMRRLAERLERMGS